MLIEPSPRHSFLLTDCLMLMPPTIHQHWCKRQDLLYEGGTRDRVRTTATSTLPLLECLQTVVLELFNLHGMGPVG